LDSEIESWRIGGLDMGFEYSKEGELPYLPSTAGEKRRPVFKGK
jgi:hypothetical protein